MINLITIYINNKKKKVFSYQIVKYQEVSHAKGMFWQWVDRFDISTTLSSYLRKRVGDIIFKLDQCFLPWATSAK